MSDFRDFEVAGWSEAGRAERYDTLVARVTARVAEPLLDATGVRGGARVLDVACGPGALVAAAASRDADPVGVDISPDMVAFARSRHPNLRFEVADAEALPFADGSFDVAVAAFLLHHVPDAQRVVGELARVGRRVAVAQWDTFDRARLLGVLSEAIREAGAVSHGPTGPSRELFASEELLEGLFRTAGLEDVRVETLAFTHRIEDADAVWNGVLAGSVNTAATINAQDEPVRRQIRERFDQLVAEYERDGAIELPVSVKIASGARR